MTEINQKRVLFFGTPEFSIPALETVAEKFLVPLVVTTPDRPRNRGRVTPTPVKKRALELGIDVFNPENINADESIERLARMNADYAVVAAYGNIIGERILAMFPDRVLNIHPSLLPRYRGASPIEHAILEGDEMTGSSIMILERGLDTGDILIKTPIPIDGMDIEELHDKLAEIGARDIVTALANYEEFYQKRIQQGSEFTYAKKLEKNDGRINWKKSNVEIDRLVRALHIAPGVTTEVGSTRLKIHQGYPVEGRGKPGLILEVSKDVIVVACGENAYAITSIQKAGGRKMDVRSFLAGNPMDKGLFFR